MIVLGIDPGSIKCGWGVVDVRGRQLTPLDYGIIRNQSKTPLAERLVRIHDGIAAVCQDHRVEVASIEDIFQGGPMKNPRSVLVLGHARGAALLAVAQQQIPLHEYTPAEVKKAVLGHGRAQKWQIQEMVRTLLGLSEVPAEDASDALSVAICHAFRMQSNLPGRMRR